MFASTQYPWAGGEEFQSMRKPREHFVPLVPAVEAAPSLAAYRKKIDQLDAESRRAEKDYEAAKLQTKDKTEQERLRRHFEKLRLDLRNMSRPGLPDEVAGAYAVQEGNAADAYLQLRGDVGQRGPVVKRNVPRFLAGDRPLTIAPGSSGRRELAEWLTRPEHPLTARVLVNRVWQHHFGKGLVATPSNFGVRGEPPTHPALLDWLAVRFVESGWSIKTLHRLIVTSQAYQRSSGADPKNAAQDPGNRWYWRYDRQRLDAESIRDTLLAASGTLARQRPGPHSFPKIESWSWTQHTPFKDVYATPVRSVYLMTQRLQRHPFLGLFDGPDTNTTTGERRTSTVPLQALFLMNNPFVQDQAEAFARRILAFSSAPHERLNWAHQQAWSRPATAEECARGLHYLETYRHETAGIPSDQHELQAWTSYARVLFCANEFVYVD
jgi:hypothetical protein